MKQKIEVVLALLDSPEGLPLYRLQEATGLSKYHVRNRLTDLIADGIVLKCEKTETSGKVRCNYRLQTWYYDPGLRNLLAEFLLAVTQTAASDTDLTQIDAQRPTRAMTKLLLMYLRVAPYRIRSIDRVPVE